MKLQYSHHKIYYENDCPFDPSEYSLFKFGNTFFAEKFANELFEGFIKENKDWILSKSEIVLLPSPYHSIPTASNFLCSYFKEKLNQFLFENGKNACAVSKIYRNQTYTEDYGNMSFEERLKLIAGDTYYIDNKFINEKCCIFLDDIKITGSHERTVEKILKEFDVTSEFAFLYFAELCNQNIHPNIENYYNYFSIKNTCDLTNIINDKRFKFNTRIVKYILKMNEDELNKILLNISDLKQEELLNLAISNNYHQIKEYQKSIKLLNKKLWQSTYKKDKEKV